MTISTFDPTTLRALREEVDAALKIVGDRNGIKLTLKTIRYSPGGLTFTSQIEGETGGAEEAEKKKAITFAKSFLGLDASEPCTHPKVSGAVLVEYRDRARKAPWVYELDGKRYVCTDQNLKLMFPKVAEPAPDIASGRGIVATEADDLIQREVAPPQGLSH